MSDEHELDELFLEKLPPDYYHKFTDEDILLRCQNRAERFARLLKLDAPMLILRREHRMLDSAFQEWVRRHDNPT